MMASPSDTPKSPPEVGSKKGCCGCGGCASCAPAEPIVGMAKPHQRKCRDGLCCIIFLLFWAGMIAIGAIGLKYGQPGRLLYGVDYKGQTCGMGDLASKKFTAYPRMNDDFLLNLAKSSPLDYRFYGVCVNSCPGTLSVVCNYEDAGINSAAATNPYTQDVLLQCLTNATYSPPTGVACSSVKSTCWVVPLQTSSVMYRCLPVYNTTNVQGSVCSYPPGITSPSDPACLLVTDSKSGTTERPAKTSQVIDAMSTARATVGRWFSDLYRAWWVIAVSAIGAAAVFGFVWLLLAKWCTGVFVWGTISLVLAGLGLLTGYFYYKAGLITVTIPDSISAQLSTYSSTASGAVSSLTYYVPVSFDTGLDSATAYKVLAGISTAVSLIVLVMVVALRGAIATAIRIIKLGAEALQSLPSLVCFPLTTVLALGVFVMWWIFVAASLATAGSTALVDASKDAAAGLTVLAQQTGISANTVAAFTNSTSLNQTFTYIEDMPTMNYLLIYHVFGLLWTTQWLVGMATITIAGGVSAWYFSRVPAGMHPPAAAGKALSASVTPVSSGETPSATPAGPASLYALERFPVIASLCRAIRYYMGTVAFAALLIAIMQFIRMVVAYLYKRMKDSGNNSAWLKFICCCLQCVLWCLQKCIEFISRNALIYSAIKGAGFCEAGGAVFRIIVANAGLLAAVNVLCEIVMWLGKILIAVSCGWVAYAILDNAATFQTGGATPVSSTWLVIAVVVFFAYAIASGFLLVFDMAVDSILICFIVDKTDNGGKALHMDASRLKALKPKPAPTTDDIDGPGGDGAAIAYASPANTPAGTKQIVIGRAAGGDAGGADLVTVVRSVGESPVATGNGLMADRTRRGSGTGGQGGGAAVMYA